MSANATTVYDEGLAPGLPQRNGAGKPTPPKTETRAKRGSAKGLMAALLFLSAIPLAAGVYRLIELVGGAEVTPANERFFTSPLPVVIHIVGSALYALLGAFQFAPRFRQRSPGWHRIVGRLLVPCGLLVGLSGVWMTLFYPIGNSLGAVLLFLFRLLFGWGMVASIVLGFVTILRGDVKRHRAWMMRAYAIGLGAGTQVFTQWAGEIALGAPTEMSKALLMGAGWAINLAVAEWAIRRKRRSARAPRAGRPATEQTSLAPRA